MLIFSQLNVYYTCHIFSVFWFHISYNACRAQSCMYVSFNTLLLWNKYNNSPPRVLLSNFSYNMFGVFEISLSCVTGRDFFYPTLPKLNYIPYDLKNVPTVHFLWCHSVTKTHSILDFWQSTIRRPVFSLQGIVHPKMKIAVICLLSCNSKSVCGQENFGLILLPLFPMIVRSGQCVCVCKYYPLLTCTLYSKLSEVIQYKNFIF